MKAVPMKGIPLKALSMNIRKKSTCRESRSESGLVERKNARWDVQLDTLMKYFCVE